MEFVFADALPKTGVSLYAEMNSPVTGSENPCACDSCDSWSEIGCAQSMGLLRSVARASTYEQRLLFAVVKISLGAFLFYSPMSDLVGETR